MPPLSLSIFYLLLVHSLTLCADSIHDTEMPQPKGKRYQLPVTPSEAAPGEPEVVIVSYDRQDSSVALKNFIAPLEACGIKPRLVDDPNAANPIGRAPAAGSVILLNAHGEGTEEAGSYTVQTQRYPKATTSGDALVKSIRRGAPGTPLWLGTCAAGSCSVKNACVGAECSAGAQASAKLYAWREISKVLCDAIKGNCELWKKLDPKGTGTVGPEALTKHVQGLPSNAHRQDFPEKIFFKMLEPTGERGKNFYRRNQNALVAFQKGDAKNLLEVLKNNLFAEPGPSTQDFELLKARCAEEKGTLGWEAPTAVIEVRGAEGYRQTLESEWKIRPSTSEDVLAFIRKAHPDFPKCKLEGVGPERVFANCTYSVEVKFSAVCQNPETIRYNAGTTNEASKTYTPDFRDFKLTSPRCVEMIQAH